MIAGIKLWVLTGDKQETAINIGYSSNLLTDELYKDEPFIVDGDSPEVQLSLSIHLLNILKVKKIGYCFNITRTIIKIQGGVKLVTVSILLHLVFLL